MSYRPIWAQELYKKNYGTKVRSTSTFRPAEMVYIDNPQLAASFTVIAKKLAVTSYRKLVSKIVRPFPLVSVKPTNLSIFEHCIHNMVLPVRTFSVPNEKPPNNAFECFFVEEESLPDNGVKITQTESIENTVARIVAHKGSEKDL